MTMSGFFQNLFNKDVPLVSVQDYLGTLVGVDRLLHPYFLKYTQPPKPINIEHIVTNIIDGSIIDNYQRGYKDILVASKQHIVEQKKANKQDEEAKNVLVLVHPFYLHLSESNQLLTARAKKEANSYLEKVFKLLEVQKNRPNYSTVMIGTAFHYALGAAHLLEKNYIQDYFITHFSSGSLLDDKQLDYLKNKNVFVAGTFNSSPSGVYTSQITEFYKSLKNRTRDEFDDQLYKVTVNPLSDMIISRRDEKHYRRLTPKDHPEHRYLNKISSQDLIIMMQDASVVKPVDPLPIDLDVEITNTMMN